MASPGTQGKPVPLGPWRAGANNLALETSVPPSSFRQGVNVDVTDDGKIVRRDGTTQVIEAEEPVSLFGYGNRGFYLEGTRLMGFEVLGGAETEPVELFDGLSPYTRLAHAMIEPFVYVSDGDQSLRIHPDNSVTAWSVPTAPDPVLTVASSGGSLASGRYHVAVAYKNGLGEEGPVSGWQWVEITEGQGITVHLSHVAPSHRSVIYMTKANGTELLHLATVPYGSPSVNVFRQHMGRPPATLDLDPLPGARFAAVWKGRLLTADGRFVRWSEPNQYGLTHAAYNYLEFAEEVTGLAAVETADGFFVGQGRHTYYVAGADPADAALATAYGAGMVPGTVTMVPGARLPFEAPPPMPVPMWLASNGVFCVGMIDGSVSPLTETRYAARTGQEGAAVFVQRAGRSRYVATVRDSQENAFAMTDQFTAEVVRNNN